MVVPIERPEVLKALRFLYSTNKQKVYPEIGEVTAFATTEEPRGQLDGFQSTAFSLAHGVSPRQLEDYLISSRLVIVTRDESYLTASGQALVREAELQTIGASEAVLEVVGRAHDPVFYAKLLTEIGKLDDAILVDPYLPSNDLYSLLKLSNITRVLTNRGKERSTIAGEDTGKRVEAMALALGAFEKRPELRVQEPSVRELHDRVVLSKTGRGLMLGTSLGGKQITVVTHLTDDTTELLLSHYESLFGAASPVEPVVRDADESA